MQIVTDIPKSIYEEVMSGDWSNLTLYGFCNAIENGVPLPKEHGRLIDADAFERRCMFDHDIEDMQDVIYAMRDYKPILEAKEQSE